MGVHSQPGTRTLILSASTVPGPTWEAGGTRTATRLTSTVSMASTVIIRYNSPLYLDTDLIIINFKQFLSSMMQHTNQI